MILEMELDEEYTDKLRVIADAYEEQTGVRHNVATIALHIVISYLDDRVHQLTEDEWEKMFPGKEYEGIVAMKVPSKEDSLETSHVGRGLSDRKRGMK